MKRQHSLVSALVICGMALALIVLAVVQYRWIGQLTESDRDRMQASLEVSVRQFRQEFNRELLGLGGAFRPDFRAIVEQNWDVYAERWDVWMQTSPYADLLGQVFVWHSTEDGPPELLRLNQTSKQFEPAGWPARFETVSDIVESQSGPRRRFGGPGGRPGLWIAAEDVPLLFQPIYRSARRRDRPPFPPGDPRQPIAYVFLELNKGFLENALFPELANRYFANSEGFVYHVAILANADSEGNSIIYSSSPAVTMESLASRDASVPLLWGPEDYLSRFAEQRRERPPGRGAGRGPGPGDDPGRTARRPPPPGRPDDGRRGFAGRFAPVLLSGSQGGGWTLAVKHTEGSLDSAVQSLRRRNLGVSFGVLVLLAISMGMIVVSAQRAQHLAKLQMQFVAGVSHELKTPLAVIRSAADNLAEGIVGSPRQIKEYGTLIRTEGRRLSAMIEQTLDFSAGQANPASYALKPLVPAEMIDAALEVTAPAIHEAQATVEKTIEPDLPEVQADENAVKQVLQNLVSNALKYGGPSKRVAIRAETYEGSSGRQVRISVADNGAGIPPEDLTHIFEPFYRGKAATDAQIQGAGLGLSLARDMARAMGAEVSVESTPGEGSSFALHLPVAQTENGAPAAPRQT